MPIVQFNGSVINSVDQAAQFTESLIHDKAITGRRAKRCFAIAIELIQNILKYSKGTEIAILEIKVEDNLPIVLTSVNYTDLFNRNRIEMKINQLKKETDFRHSFQKKLEAKMESPSPQTGDFGLDFCFRFSRDCIFKITPAKDDLEIIHLQFIVD